MGSSYNLSVCGPNGFARYFQGSIGSRAAVLDVVSKYEHDDHGSLELIITNAGAKAEVSVLDAYTGDSRTRLLQSGETWEEGSSLERFYGWYDLIVTVEYDSTFQYGLAGHVETGKDSFPDPGLGGLVTLKG